MLNSLEDITLSLIQIISGVLQVPSEDLGAEYILSEHPTWDSLSQLETLLLVEEKFGIEFPVLKLSGISTVSEFARIVKEI
jgi:acyl carrier protein